MEIQEMALQRMVAPTFFSIAALCASAASASAACDSRTFSMFYAAEKSAWDSQNFSRLYVLNLENAKYADACGHQEIGLNRGRLLEQAASQYQTTGLVELGKHQYALAKKHLHRSNAIFRELQASGTAPRPDYVAVAIRRNDASLASIPKNAS
jgi:hypothetical protein